ncbi:hypothetical protein ACFLUZ_07390 [Chloroflexota bacterium]
MKLVKIVEASGGLSGSCCKMQGAQCAKAKSGEIKLPVKSKWVELLKKAEEDLGPLP